jgi:hypothetical protein
MMGATPQRNKHSYSTQARVTPALALADGEPQPEQAATIVNVASADSGDVPTTAATPARAPATPAKPVQPVTRVAAAPHAAAQPADSDVTLLTALVAHAGKPSEVTPERNRDVVERQDGDTTAQLLARCKQLGLIEGMLCRSRICSGRWEGCGLPHAEPLISRAWESQTFGHRRVHKRRQHALDVGELVELHQLAGAVEANQVAHPREDGDIGNGVLIAHDPLAAGQALLQHRQQAADSLM